jgi:hypothetical protein
MLVGKIAGGEALAVRVWRDPEVLGHECRSLRYARLGTGHSLHVAMWHQSVGDRLADRISALRIHDPPDPAPQGVDQLLRFQFGAQRGARGAERCPEDVAGTGRIGFRVLLIDRVHRPIDIEIEPEVEEVLVDRAVQAIAVEELAVGRGLVRG